MDSSAPTPSHMAGPQLKLTAERLSPGPPTPTTTRDYLDVPRAHLTILIKVFYPHKKVNFCLVSCFKEDCIVLTLLYQGGVDAYFNLRLRLLRFFYATKV